MDLMGCRNVKELWKLCGFSKAKGQGNELPRSLLLVFCQVQQKTALEMPNEIHH